jgi:glyoxylate/hydroxypyruvate reductase A
MSQVAVAIGEPARALQWRDALRRAAPELSVDLLGEVKDCRAVQFAVVWRASMKAIRDLPSLRAVLSIGAGVDGILRDTDLPAGVSVIRMVDDALTQGMREYVLLHVLRHHRGEPQQRAAQAMRRWEPRVSPLAQERSVGVMGLGVLGRDAAQHLVNVGFKVKGWSRTDKCVEGVETVHGDAALRRFASEVEILVCLLPLTRETENILDARLFDAMPMGSSIVNAARGELLVERDLLTALESGRIAGATLDAFRDEPLPAAHPFWTHPAITVTPHSASLTRTESGAQHLVAEIRLILAGRPPRHAIDRAAGY